MDWLWICLDCGATIVSDSGLFRNCSREESRCQICKHEFPTPMYIPDMECNPGWGILWCEADMSEECNIGAAWSIDWWA
jgi:hypothetical protein